MSLVSYPGGVFHGVLIGRSGTGKTGSLLSLVDAGYRLFILDFDRGVSVLRHRVKPERIGQVSVVTLVDKLAISNLRLISGGVPQAAATGFSEPDRGWVGTEGAPL